MCFFFKQKTAYELRISDWSSDVCSSDLLSPAERLAALTDFDAVLGLDLATITREALRVRPKAATITPEAIADRLAERLGARADKDFARSDAIRDALTAAGVEVMEGDPPGWDWALGLGR